MISPDDAALVRMRAVFAEYLARIDANWHATDADALHDLRVAIRRTRALLANAKGVVRERDRARFAAGFGDLARATTVARDLDVAVDDWPALAQLAHVNAEDLATVHDALRARRDAARASVAAALTAPATHALLEDWRAWLDAKPDLHASRARKPIAKVVRRRARKIQRRLVRLARRDSAEARHAWRKEAKRLRYLAEAFPDSFKRKLVPSLTKAQDALGRERDRIVQAALMDELGAPELASALRAAPTPKDRRRKVARSLQRWIRAA